MDRGLLKFGGFHSDRFESQLREFASSPAIEVMEDSEVLSRSRGIVCDEQTGSYCIELGDAIVWAVYNIQDNFANLQAKFSPIYSSVQITSVDPDRK